MIVIPIVALIGFGVGLLVRRWSVVLAVLVLGVLVGASGVIFGWAGSYDVAPLGGVIILGIFFWGPFVLGLALGVSIRRPTAPDASSTDKRSAP